MGAADVFATAFRDDQKSAQLPHCTSTGSNTYGGDTTHQEIDCWEDAGSATTAQTMAARGTGKD